MSESAVHDPWAVKEFEREPPEVCSCSERASFSRAHDSKALPNVLAAVDSAASASLYCFALVRRSEYAV
jgi:hypothetical protein